MMRKTDYLVLGLFTFELFTAYRSKGESHTPVAQEQIITEPKATDASIPNEAPPKKRRITIINGIDDTMLKYKHWTGRYKPTLFTLACNDQTIEQGEKKTVEILDDKLSVVYEYEFMNGRRKGKKRIDFTVDQSHDTLELTFKWKDKWHVYIDHAEPYEITEI